MSWKDYEGSERPARMTFDNLQEQIELLKAELAKEREVSIDTRLELDSYKEYRGDLADEVAGIFQQYAADCVSDCISHCDDDVTGGTVVNVLSTAEALCESLIEESEEVERLTKRVDELLADNTRLELARREETIRANATKAAKELIERENYQIKTMLLYGTPEYMMAEEPRRSAIQPLTKAFLDDLARKFEEP